MIKKILKQLLDFFVFSNLWIAVCAGVQVLSVYISVKEPANFDIVIFVSAGTFFIYNIRTLIQYKLIGPNTEIRFPVSFQGIPVDIKAVLLLIVITPLLLLYFSFKFNNEALYIFSAAGILSIFYYIPLYKKKSLGINLRQIGLLKTILITLVWILASTIGPLLQAGRMDIADDTVLITCAKKFLFLFALILAFDIRDLNEDSKLGLRTLVFYIQPKGARFFCISALLLDFILNVFLSPSTKFWIGQSVFLTISIVFIWFSTIKKSDYYYLFWIDGLLFLQFLFLVFLY